ncbi:NIPSNAP family protein [Pseudomonas veronii]|uniref:NIPSNAP family protein n=1 Tax=Pseudomonas veronii TaxID=76761 RepID=UPI001E3E7478|nr:NIPSNAP family protein [Pseudomonas veronii]MDF3239367.1 NIPSNAP family protein [Pseudomonas veronii]UHH32083.1 NIPSNAP family protein [Pseudomonas veronii]
MVYELTTFSCTPLTEGAVAVAACDWIGQGPGLLLGVWRSEIGDLFQVKLLRGFETLEALQEERRRALMSMAPFGITDATIKVRSESYKRFPFLADIEPAKFGRFYEFRTYFLKPGGLAPTMASWQEAIVPAGEYTSHLVTNLYALDGPPRITHIWGFASLEERGALRARHYAAGLWPPKGAPQQIARASTMICVPEDYSPLR